MQGACVARDGDGGMVGDASADGGMTGDAGMDGGVTADGSVLADGAMAGDGSTTMSDGSVVVPPHPSSHAHMSHGIGHSCSLLNKGPTWEREANAVAIPLSADIRACTIGTAGGGSATVR